MTTSHSAWNDPTAPQHVDKNPMDSETIRDTLVRRSSTDAAALLASSIAKTLENLCDTNEKHSVAPEVWEPASLFYSRTRQNFSMEWYIQRLFRHADCSKSAFVVALIYLGRIQEMGQANFVPVEMNVHRLYLTSLVLAIKFLDEPVYDNLHYARVGGVGSLDEMNALEVELLQALDHRLSVETEEYESVKKLMLGV